MDNDKTMIHGFDIQLKKIWTLLQTIDYFKARNLNMFYQDNYNKME